MTHTEIKQERDTIEEFMFCFTSVEKQHQLIELRDEAERVMWLERTLPSMPSVITSK